MINIPRFPNENLIDERTDPSFYAKAFPHLFPFGTGLFVADRPVPLRSITAYYRHLIAYHDRRFVLHKKFLFFAFNTVQRKHASGAVLAADRYYTATGRNAAPVDIAMLRRVNQSLAGTGSGNRNGVSEATEASDPEDEEGPTIQQQIRNLTSILVVPIYKFVYCSMFLGFCIF